ncbi:polysaccharide biosynthesis/export family protein [Marivita sp. S2033]|uniref:polysaccharide biosynthesis/export family protein n=1 Tax=Marivita sp. S2033 TaxID=3373187 RepID=UPI003982A64C
MFLSVASFVGPATSAEQYALGPGDQIEISVMSRPELSRVYRVRLDGAISLHILGEIQAEGKTPADLEKELEENFSEIFAGSTSITLEVTRYRPVIVGGQVVAPGAYDFFAGLDVAAAVALAGGSNAVSGDDDVATQMRVEAEAARYASLRARLAGRLLERARLVAERDGDAAIAMPAEAQDTLGDAAVEMLEGQAALRAVRDEQLSQRLSTGDASRILAEEEAAAYSERRNLIRRQVDATTEELEVQKGLAERGLARSQRSFDLSLSVDRFRADELEAVALEAAAREKASDAQAGQTLAERQRAGEVVQALSEIDAEIAEIRTDIDRARRFVSIFGDPQAAGLGADVTTHYLIRRRDNDSVARIEATPDTPLLPGDMVEVSLDEMAAIGGE